MFRRRSATQHGAGKSLHVVGRCRYMIGEAPPISPAGRQTIARRACATGVFLREHRTSAIAINADSTGSDRCVQAGPSAACCARAFHPELLAVALESEILLRRAVAIPTPAGVDAELLNVATYPHPGHGNALQWQRVADIHAFFVPLDRSAVASDAIMHCRPRLSRRIPLPTTAAKYSPDWRGRAMRRGR